MAIRTTEEAVQGIIEVDSSIPLTPFIEVASSLVDELCVDSGYSDARLELIERWLSAHFYSVRDPRPSSQSAGGVSQSLQGSVGLNLTVTVHGQQVMLLDTAGNFAQLQAMAKSGTPRRASVVWLGTTSTES